MFKAHRLRDRNHTGSELVSPSLASHARERMAPRRVLSRSACKHSVRRPIDPARRHVRAWPPQTGNLVIAKARPQLQCDQAALRGRFMEKSHDRTPNKTEVELQANPVSAGFAHVLLQLVSNPAAKAAGPFTSFMAKRGSAR